MGNTEHSFYPAHSANPETKIVAGSFRPNGATGIVSGSQKGRGFSVARTSEGLYTATFRKAYPHLLSFVGSARAADGKPLLVTGGDYVQASKTMQIRVQRPGAGFHPLDITAMREIASNDIQNLAAHGGLLASDSTPILERINAATDKALAIKWAASDSNEAQFPPFPLPPDLGGGLSVHLMMAMIKAGASVVDTPTVDVQAFSGKGDTEMGAATAAVEADGTPTEYSAAISAANLGDHPGFLNVSLIPGAHTTDELDLFAAWIEYDQLVDLSADADSVVNFVAVFQNSGVPAT